MKRIAILFILSLIGCKKTPAPVPPPAADTLVVVVPGLGAAQTGKLAAAVRSGCPRALVVNGPSWDGYKLDIPGVVSSYPALAHRVLIGHSFGGAAVVLAGQLVGRIDYEAVFDPVDPGGADGSLWGDLPYPANAVRFDYFVRTDLVGPRVARIAGATPIYTIGGHDDGVNDAGVIARVVGNINALSPETP